MTDNQATRTATTVITAANSQNIGKKALIKDPNHKRNKSPSEFVNSNFDLDRKIKEACKGLTASTQWSLV